MGNVPRLAKFLLGVAGISLAALGPARQTGGSYTLSINGGAAFSITGIDFGSKSVSNDPTGAASGREQLSPVTVTVSAASAQLYSLFSSCITGQHLAKVAAVYSNSQGETQFTVNFQPVVVTSYTFPTVDKTSAPLGDITIVFTAGAEQFTTPPPPTTRTLINNRVASKTTISTSPISRSWHTPMASASPGTKFTFTIPDVNTSGVTSVLSFSGKGPPESSGGGGAGKVSLTSFSVTVNPTAAADLVKDAQSNARVPTVTLALNRLEPSGANLPLTIVFRDVLFSGFNIGGDHPIATINLSAASVEVQSAGIITKFDLGTVIKSL